MYGMVNKSLQSMVSDRYGADVWGRIKKRAGVDIDVFVSNAGYPDDITYGLIGAASETLNVPARTMLEEFGKYWVLVTARAGYGDLLYSGGKTFRDFLINLPAFHNRVCLIFPELQPPEFSCSEIEANSLRLHYHSKRPGLAPFVIGLIRGLSEMYDTAAQIEHISSREDGAEDDVFRISWQA